MRTFIQLALMTLMMSTVVMINPESPMNCVQAICCHSAVA